MPIDLTITQEARAYLCLVALRELALRERLPYVRRARFAASELGDLSALGEVLLDERREGVGTGVLVRSEDGVLIAVSATHGAGDLAVAGTDAASVDELVRDLSGALRDTSRDDREVPVTFFAGGGGSVEARRRIVAPTWREIAGNYGEQTAEVLAEVMQATEPGEGGLLLWHGAPGTGKSYALRALAREWQPWCDTWFIADPDVFLGPQSSYLLQALLHSDTRGTRHRLIVLEDAGELLAADARAQAGQALSRLLNLSDGLLGSGLRTLVLVTTNEPLRRLHPAVARPGRCWAEIDFEALDLGQANAWLADRGSDAVVDSPTTLADLYALAAGHALRTVTPVGFAA